MATAKPRMGTCRACGERRDVDAQRGLLAAELAWVGTDALKHGLTPGSQFFPLSDGMRRLAERGHDKWFWACDGCLASGAAIVALPGKQTLGLGMPFAAYVARPFTCEDCGEPAVFGAREQQHWFETLRFLIWVHPKQCAPCRKTRRRRATTNTELAAALHELDPADPSQLEAVARLYEELGATSKATEFHARARNRRKAKR